MKQEIIIKVSITVDQDIPDHHRINTVMNSLNWVASRIRKGDEHGNLHGGTSGPPHGHFTMTKTPLP